MGNCCSNATLTGAVVDEETLLLHPEAGDEEPSLITTSYDTLASEEGTRILQEEDILQELAVQTANNLINISDQTDDSKGLIPAQINPDYERILSAFDNSTNMITFLPSKTKLRTHSSNANSSLLYSLMVSKPPPAFELELVDMAASQVAISMTEFSTDYVGDVFAPFTASRA